LECYKEIAVPVLAVEMELGLKGRQVLVKFAEASLNKIK
jgi:hypothetical protein